MLAAVVSGVVTVVAWTGSAEFGPDPETVIVLLYLDTVLLLLLGAIVVRQLVRVWAERRRGLAGSGLHVRIVILFSLVAVTPAILVAVFSALFLNFGIQAWFSERVRTAVEASSAVAQAYLGRASSEHPRRGLRHGQRPQPRRFSADAQSVGVRRAAGCAGRAAITVGGGRSLTAAAGSSSRAPLSLTLELDLVPGEVIEEADTGQVVVLSTERDDRVRAAVKLNRFIDAYLVIGRFLDPQVLAQIERTEMAVAQYRRLEQSREGILITFVMIFIIVALLLLLAAVWMGLTLATHISRPISGLIAAAERVRDGDMSVRVKPVTTIGEFAMLGRAFNRMTSQLQSQQTGLLLANRDLDERRRFTEAVLSGVSAGVIGLDAQATINLPNRSASELLGLDLDRGARHAAGRSRPRDDDLIRSAVEHPERTCEAEVRLIRASRPRTLIVRIAAERLDGEVIGYVVTFDDITALVQAERKAAWADVARRIAHEIKNPLTPIQLASERLKRKYSREIKSDPDTFVACTETIIRQVEDIGRMVDEFSSFARMPRPELKPENICELVRQAVFLERNRFPDIRIELTMPEQPLPLLCDARLVSQALINVLKNAAEAVQAATRTPRRTPGWIGVSVMPQAVDDPSQHRRRRRGQRSRPAARGSRPPDRTLRHDAGKGNRARSRHRQEDHGGS